MTDNNKNPQSNLFGIKGSLSNLFGGASKQAHKSTPSKQTQSQQQNEQNAPSSTQTPPNQTSSQPSNLFNIPNPQTIPHSNKLNPFLQNKKLEDQGSKKEENNPTPFSTSNTIQNFQKKQNMFQSKTDQAAPNNQSKPNNIFQTQPNLSNLNDQQKIFNSNPKNQTNLPGPMNALNPSSQPALFSLSSFNQQQSLFGKQSEPKKSVVFSSNQPTPSGSLLDFKNQDKSQNKLFEVDSQPQNQLNQQSKQSPNILENQHSQSENIFKNGFKNIFQNINKNTLNSQPLSGNQIKENRPKLALQTKDTTHPDDKQELQNNLLRVDGLKLQGISNNAKDAEDIEMKVEQFERMGMQGLSLQEIKKLQKEKQKQLFEQLQKIEQDDSEIQLKSNISELNQKHLAQLDKQLAPFRNLKITLKQKIQLLKKENPQNLQKLKQLQKQYEQENQIHKIIGKNQSFLKNKIYPESAIIKQQLSTLITCMCNYFNPKEDQLNLTQNQTQDPEKQLRNLWKNLKQQKQTKQKLLKQQQKLSQSNANILNKIQFLKMERMALQPSNKNPNLFSNIRTKSNLITEPIRLLKRVESSPEQEKDKQDSQSTKQINQLSNIRKSISKDQKTYEQMKGYLIHHKRRTQISEGRSSIIIKSIIME